MVLNRLGDSELAAHLAKHADRLKLWEDFKIDVVNILEQERQLQEHTRCPWPGAVNVGTVLARLLMNAAWLKGWDDF